MLKSIELDPYEEWNPCNSPDIVNFSQCHSENRRNQYRRRPVQSPIEGKSRVQNGDQTSLSLCVWVSERESESCKHNQMNVLQLFSLPIWRFSIKISPSNELDLDNFWNSSQSRGVCSLSLCALLFRCNSSNLFIWICICMCVCHV